MVAVKECPTVEQVQRSLHINIQRINEQQKKCNWTFSSEGTLSVLYSCCTLALLQSESVSVHMLNSSLFLFETLLPYSIIISTSSITRKPLLTFLRLCRGEIGKSASNLQTRNTMKVSLSEQNLY